MTKEDSMRISSELAQMIARDAPYLDYTQEQVEAYRRVHPLDNDPEKGYVMHRFIEITHLEELAGREYTQKLIAQAKRYTKEQYDSDPFLRSIHVRDALIGDFLLMNAEYARGEFFQYDMPDLESDLVVPFLGFCSENVIFPAVYEKEMPWVSVCPSEINSMNREIGKAQGNCLILGLGLGYYPYRISFSDAVKSITIIERQQEIIDLFKRYILPQFPYKDKITVVKSDAYAYLDNVVPGQFDFCFADIWEGQKDGAYHYARIKPYEYKLPGTLFTYWIEKEIKYFLSHSL